MTYSQYPKPTGVNCQMPTEDPPHNETRQVGSRTVRIEHRSGGSLLPPTDHLTWVEGGAILNVESQLLPLEDLLHFVETVPHDAS